MDENSPEKSTEVFNEEDGASLGDKMDLNAYENKDCGLGGLEHESEVPNGDIQVYPSEGYASPPMPLGEVNEEGTQYTLLESNSVGSSLPVSNSEETIGSIERNLGVKGAERKISDYGTEGVRSSSLDHQKHGHDAEAGATFENYRETEDFNHHHGSPLEQGDVAQYDLMDREYYEKHSANFSAPGEAVNDNVGDVSVFPQPEGIVVNEVMDGEHLNRKSSHQTPMGEGCYSRMLPPENGGMVWKNSSLQSPQDTQNVSPSPERRLSVSAECSPHTQSPPKGHASPRQQMGSSANFDQKSEPSPPSSTRRHSPSPEKHSLGHKRASSRDRSSPPARTKSPPERASKREARHRDDSRRRHLSRSPQKRESPRRRGRSTSKSPMRRDSPGRDQHQNAQRDHRRSRSRSPIARDRSRKSPRRNSPRRRSPPPTYPSRHRSLRRQWSPPANRNTGTVRPGKKLFVAGFSYVTTERDLERKFSKFGRVTDVHIARDRRSGDSRGFGFLSFELDEDADAAILALDQTEWNGRIVLVEKSKTSTR